MLAILCQPVPYEIAQLLTSRAQKLLMVKFGFSYEFVLCQTPLECLWQCWITTQSMNTVQRYQAIKMIFWGTTQELPIIKGEGNFQNNMS